MKSFEGIWVPLVTPFRGGELDVPAVQRLADLIAGQGVAGLVVAATTGEAATLSEHEKAVLLDAVLQAVDGRCPVLMGVAGSDTADMARRARHYVQHGIAGLLVTAPAYLRPSQQGIRLHFESIAAAVADTPIVIYNIPYRTGVSIDVDTCIALASNPQFVAIKESGGGDMSRLMALITGTPLKVLSGEDTLIFVNGCLGGHGAIAAAALVLTADYVQMDRHLRQGEWMQARAMHERLLPLIQALFSEPNPAPLKAALAMQGLMEEELRLPMVPVTPACRSVLRAALQTAGAL